MNQQRKPTQLTYRDAGLDLDLYEQSLAAMPPLLRRTHTPRVLDGFGGFASLFILDYNSLLFAKNYRRPVLVTCTDCVVIVEKDHIVNGRAIRPGDIVLGLASSGIHSNGYSLVRKVVFEHAGLKVGDFVPELGRTVGEELLEPTRIYVRAVKSILRHYPVKRRVVRGLAHITGGGLVDNLPRVLPPGRRAFLKRGSWPVPPVFNWLQRLGNVA